MKVVILAGGQKSAITGEQEGIPKPMAELGGRPLLWHIMKSFSAYGMNEFIVCGGYKIEFIKEYFMDFYIYESDITVDLQSNTVKIHKKKTEDWKVTVVDTGLEASTGERVQKVREYIDEDDFIVTYGDCLYNISIDKMRKQHIEHGKMVTAAVAKPVGRKELFPVETDGTIPADASHYIKQMNAWINASCYIMNRKVFDHLENQYDLEKQLLTEMSERNELSVYKHDGYWTAIETKRDLMEAESLWSRKEAPWITQQR